MYEKTLEQYVVRNDGGLLSRCGESKGIDAVALNWTTLPSKKRKYSPTSAYSKLIAV